MPRAFGEKERIDSMEENQKPTNRVFSDQWIMEQMQALMDLYARQKARTRTCMVFTALSVLLSLLAIVIR